MTAQLDRPTFDTTYEDWRPRVYRALVLATGDRDAALDAVDAGFTRRKRAITRTGGTPPAEALGAARRHLTRKRRDYSGFRLPDQQPGPETTALIAAVRTLDLGDRLAVVASRYLGWDDVTIGRGLGMLAGEVAQRTQIATQRILAATGSSDAGTIDAAMHDVADRTVVPLSRLDSVKRNARVRRIGVFAGALGVAAALGGGTMLALNLALGSDDPDAITGNATPGETAAIESTSALADLEWNRAVLTSSGNGEMSALSAGEDGYLGLFMDYTSGSNQLQILTSPNGLDWEVGGELDLGPSGGWVSQLTFGAGRWAAVTSTFDPVDGRDQPMLLLSDDGVSWTPVEIPVEDTITVGDFTATVGTNFTSIVLGEDSITVVGSQWGDFEQLTRHFAPDDVSLDFGWDVDQNGTFTFYDSNGEVSTRMSAEELGFPVELVGLLQGNSLVAYHSGDDGQTWDPLAQTGIGPGWVSSTTMVNGTLIGTFGVANGTALYRLDDVGWERIDVGDGGLPNAVATFDGRAYAAGADATGAAAVWSSTDGKAWRKVTLPTLEDTAFGMISASPHGLIASGYPNAVLGPAVVTVDDLTVTISASGVYTVTDAEENVLAEVFQEDLEHGETITIVDADTGEDVVSLEQGAIDAAWSEVYMDADRGFAEGGVPQTNLVASVDGVTWVRLPIEEVLPPGLSVNYQVVGPAGVVISGWSDQGAIPFPGGGNGQQVWAGTVPGTD